MRSFGFALPLIVALACTRATRAHAASAPAAPHWYAEFAIGGGAGAARVEGARLEFGRDRFAVGMALHGGRLFGAHARIGLHLDAVGAGSGKVVPLGAGFPVAPATTEHRVAVNHFSVVATWTPGSGLAFARAGVGLAESFTEDWTAPDKAVHRSFGPGAVAGIGVAPRLKGGARVPVALDAMVGDYSGRTGWGAMFTVGIASR